LRVAIVGGGIGGLAAAWELRGRAEVTVFEPDRLGGRIKTTMFGGHLIDEGPDAFLTRVPEGLELCRQLGIDGELISPAAGSPLLWLDGRLRPLPEGLVLGVPRRLVGVIRSGILSPLGVARAALELVLPRRSPPEDLTVWELVAQRFGPQVADRLVDPLVGGIHAGATSQLGAAEVTPQLVAAAQRSRSLLLGLRQSPTAGPGPMFAAPRDGVGRLADALVASLGAAAVRFERSRVERVVAGPGGQVIVAPDPDPFDAVVVATPARVASGLLGLDGTAELARLRTASVAVVTISFAGSVLPPGSSGFLVPRGEGRLMTACSFASTKWPHWSEPGTSLVRVSAGRDGDRTALELDDDTLTDRLVDELSRALGRALSPDEVRVSRWPDSFPQFGVGHRQRMAAVEAAVARQLPTVALAGASYQGSGLPACIASGRKAARQVLESVVALAQ